MDFSSFFFDNNIRLDEIIWLAANLDCPSEALVEEFFDNTDADEFKKVFGKLPFKVTDARLDEERESGEKYSGILSEFARAQKTGFLVQAATPIPVMVHDDGGVTTYGFGWITTQWFYTEALDEAFAQRVLKWKEDFYKEKKAELKKKKKAEAKKEQDAKPTKI